MEDLHSSCAPPSSDVESTLSIACGHSESTGWRAVPNFSDAVPGGWFDISSVEIHFEAEPPLYAQRRSIKKESLDVYPRIDSDSSLQQYCVTSEAVQVEKGNRVSKLILLWMIWRWRWR